MFKSISATRRHTFLLSGVALSILEFHLSVSLRSIIIFVFISLYHLLHFRFSLSLASNFRFLTIDKCKKWIYSTWNIYHIHTHAHNTFAECSHTSFTSKSVEKKDWKKQNQCFTDFKSVTHFVIGNSDIEIQIKLDKTFRFLLLCYSSCGWFNL